VSFARGGSSPLIRTDF